MKSNITRHDLHSRLSFVNVFGHFSPFEESSLFELTKYLSKMMCHILRLTRRLPWPGNNSLCGQMMSSLNVFKLLSMSQMSASLFSLAAAGLFTSSMISMPSLSMALMSVSSCWLLFDLGDSTSLSNLEIKN